MFFEDERRKTYLLFFGGALVGIILFCMCYGIKILDVTYDTWLYYRGDLTSHYLGWKYYRSSSWHCPVGLIDGLVYPNLVSIIYTDSIPIAALLFKFLSPLLPSTFQYFGLFGLFSFMLQGGLAALITHRFTKKVFFCYASSVLFVLFPPVLQRMFSHTALAGHFIILLAILIWINYDKLNSKQLCMAWGGMGVLSVSLHFYFVPMVGGFMFGNLLEDFFKRKRLREVSLAFFCFVFAVIVTFWLLGGFVNISNTLIGDINSINSNLNTLINPLYPQVSHFIDPLPVFALQYEGFGYLGLGSIIIVSITAAFSISKLLINGLRSYKFEAHKAAVTVMLCTFCLLAIFPSITWNQYDLFSISFPRFVTNVLLIFRSNGRFIWCAGYILLITSIKYIAQIQFKFDHICIIVCVIIQIYDLSPWVRDLHWKFNDEMRITSTISPLFSQAFQGMKNVNMLPLFYFVDEPDTVSDIVRFASENGATTNWGNIARGASQNIRIALENQIKNFANGELLPDNIYILPKSLINNNIPGVGHVYVIDDFYLFSRNEIKALKEEEVTKATANYSAVIGDISLGLEVLDTDEDIHYCFDEVTMVPGLFMVNGWCFKMDEDSSEGEVYLRIELSDGSKVVLSCNKRVRQDVADAYGDNLYQKSGIQCIYFLEPGVQVIHVDIIVKNNRDLFFVNEAWLPEKQ